MRHEGTPQERRVVAIGDLHGDAPPFLRFLVEQRLIEVGDGPGLNWRDPQVVLVQTGDIPDRGPDTVRLAAAIHTWRQQGATIYTLVGNHDVPYLSTDDPLEMRERVQQALPYMVNSEGQQAWSMPDYEDEYARQSTVITSLHQHHDGGLIALRLGSVLFVHTEPGPDTFTDDDLDRLESEGRVLFDNQRHNVYHVAIWGRAYTCGTDDHEGGYRPERQQSIPGTRNYEPAVLKLHELEPRIRRLYERLGNMGVETVVHGHLPGPCVRRYQVCGVEHFNIDEAINLHYRMLFAFGASEAEHQTFVPQGWSRTLAL